MTDKKSVEFIKGLTVQFPLMIVLDSDRHEEIANECNSKQQLLQLYTHACIWLNTGNPARGSSSYPAAIKYGTKFFNINFDIPSAYSTLARKIHGVLKAMNSETFREYFNKRRAMLLQYVNESGWPRDSEITTTPLFSADSIFSTKGKRVDLENLYRKVTENIFAAVGSMPLGIGDSPAYMPVLKNGEVMLLAIFSDDPIYKYARSIKYTENAGSKSAKSDTVTKAESVQKANDLIERVMSKDYKLTDNSALAAKKTKASKKPKKGKE